MAKKSELSETILRSEVQPCSPSIEYYPLDRQIVLKTEMIDEDGNDYGKPMEESFYSVIQTYFNNGAIDDLNELKALEDCFLFGLTEIAKARAKLVKN